MLAILFLAWTIPAVAGVTLSEIMFDPSGDESTDEFIELYNDSPFPVNLANWLVTDGEDTDRVVAVEQGTTVFPNSFVLILDPDYLEGSSESYDGLIPQTALVMTVENSTIGSRGLSNSTMEEVSLLNAQGFEQSRYRYSIGNVPGRSDEKRVLSGGDSLSNWADSQVEHGSPGGSNSVTPPSVDLAVSRLYWTPAEIEQGSEFALHAMISNLGIQSASNSFRLNEVVDGDSSHVIREWPIFELPPGDSLTIDQQELILDLPARTFVGSLLESDDRPANNVRSVTVRPGGAGLLVINEIMYSPTAGRGEWVELYNTGGNDLEIDGWTFADGTALDEPEDRVELPAVVIGPESYYVLAEDSSIFFDISNGNLVTVIGSAFPSLNNNGDSIAVFDAEGALADRVDYRSQWGGDTGVSLERISASSASNDPLNWASSLDTLGGTPGVENSRSIEGDGHSDQILELSPNPFSPDDDGQDDILRVRYRLEYADSRIDLRIFDVRGRQVRELAGNAAAGFAGELLWNGRDENGGVLPTGMYVVYLESLGKGQSRIQTVKRVVVLARRS